MIKRGLPRVVVVVIALGCAGSPAFADDVKGARSWFEAGKHSYAAGDFRSAITAFTAAMRLSPRPLLTYNVALCHERLGEFAEAARVYRGYLRQWPTAPDRLVVAQRIAELEEMVRLERTHATPPASRPEPLPLRLEPKPGTAFDDTPRRLRWTWAAAGTTLAAAVAATIVSVMVPLKHADLRDSCGRTPTGCSPGQIAELQDRATAANALWITTGVLAVATVAIVWWERRRQRRAHVALQDRRLAVWWSF